MGGGIIKTNVVDDVAFVNQLVDDNPNTQINYQQQQQQKYNQQQYHHDHQKQQQYHQHHQHHQHQQQQQQQHESPSRFAPGLNLMKDNEFGS